MQKKNHYLTPTLIKNYVKHLKEEERSAATIEKYVRDLTALQTFLCESAGVEPGKVFPHNLRHFFDRTFYSLERDLSRLADILGHSSVNTTRIYTAESGAMPSTRSMM